MSIGHHAGNLSAPTVISPETMYRAIKSVGIIPFFENLIPGYSIEEMTAPQFWFDGDGPELGPWDWKIDCVQSGDIAYGKFLLGGKAAFATIKWYAELLNWRRSQDKYQPTDKQRIIMDYLKENGSIGIREVRGLLGVKKNEADTNITRLQMQCRVITGDITRVYRGEDLHYNGWQRSSFCTPEDLFELEGNASGHSPQESYELLSEHIHSIAPAATEAQIKKLLA